MDDFSLVNGGPKYRLLHRMGLSRLGAQVGVLAFAAWLPLAALSAAYHELSFFSDVTAYARFLIAIPLLIFAERVVHARTSPVAKHFATSGLVEEADQQRLSDAAVRLSARRDSYVAELVLLPIAYVAAFLAHPLMTHRGLLPWRAGGDWLSPAGWYYLLVSMPIYNFLLLRWFWRIILWFSFLSAIARLNLRLIPTHPDRTGGLAVLEISQIGFWPVALAGGVVISAVVAQAVVLRQAGLRDFDRLILVYLVLVPVVLIGPLMMFSMSLIRTKIRGLLDYGALGNTYADLFHRKWVKTPGADKAILGTSDIQSLADLHNSFEVIRKMRPVPFGTRSILALVVASAAPFLPLALTEVSLAQIAGRLLKILF